MKHLYLFSGLGADHRAFARMDFGGRNVTHIQWQQPLRNESLSAYAARLAQQITAPAPAFIGLSFGGIVAGEVAKIVRAERLILVSSAKSFREIPPYYRWAGALRLHRAVPAKMLTIPNRFADWAFGIRAPADRQVLADILRDTDPQFLRWAMDALVHWRGAAAHPRLHHIHGSADHILPIRYTNAVTTIPGGGHLMTLTHAAEVSAVVRQLLEEG